MNVERRYGLVRIIAAVLKIIAVIVLVLGIAGLVASFSWGNRLQLPQQLMISGGIGAFVVALVTSVELYAFGSILSLLVKIEENTRAMLLPPED